MSTLNRNAALLLGGAGVGGALMYLLDPDRGRRRRAYLRDQAVHAAHAARSALATGSRDLANRSRGVVSEASGMIREKAVSDEVLVARVRAEMGHVVSHPRALHVEAREGRVTLSGPILRRDLPALRARIHRVRGVREVVEQLEVHDTPGDVPALQESPGEHGSGGTEMWLPATRLLAGAAGGALTAYGVAAARRRDPLGVPAGLLGAGLMLRSMTNRPLGEALALSGACCSGEFRQSMEIRAPAEEVYRFCSRPQNVPHYISYVKDVQRLSENRVRWVLAGPAGMTLELDELMSEPVPGRRMEWRSAPGAMISFEGSLEVHPTSDHSCRLEMEMRYGLPGGRVTEALASLFGASPQQCMRGDLMRLKSLLETGKATVGGREVYREEMEP
ncbi:MAG: SRPBCC family protein [Armatimonadota bacterium]